MYFQNEVAPQIIYQNVEPNNTSRSLANHCLNPNEPFYFGIEFLDYYVREIYKYTSADYRQIEMKAMQNLAMLLNYGGFDDILPFYILDLSPTGSGKDKNHNIQEKIIIALMVKELDTLEKEKKKICKEKKEKAEQDHMLKIYRCYHNGTSTSPQFFLRAAIRTHTQMIYFNEFGKALANPSIAPIIDFCIENWGKDTLTAPSEHKNYLHGEDQIIKCKIFCDMKSSLKYLTKARYIHELQGGLLNRPLTYCQKEIIEKDDILDSMEDDEKEKMIKQVSKILEFARAFKGHKLIKNQINSNEITKQFRALVKDYKASYKEIYQDYFVRLEYNYKAILIALHYLSEFDFWRKNPSYTPSARITNESYKKAFYFMLNYIENFEVIVNKLENNHSEDTRLEKILAKIKEFQDTSKLPMSFSAFGAFIRPRLKADELRKKLSNFVEINQNGQITSLKSNKK